MRRQDRGDNTEALVGAKATRTVAIEFLLTNSPFPYSMGAPSKEYLKTILN
jgi:hypothetical protein